MPIRVISKDEKKYRDKVKKLKEGKATTGLKSGGSTKMPMVMKDGKKIPAFAADGVGKMKKGGSTKKAAKKVSKTKKQQAAIAIAKKKAKKKPAKKMMYGGKPKKMMYGGRTKKM